MILNPSFVSRPVLYVLQHIVNIVGEDICSVSGICLWQSSQMSSDNSITVCYVETLKEQTL